MGLKNINTPPPLIYYLIWLKKKQTSVYFFLFIVDCYVNCLHSIVREINKLKYTQNLHRLNYIQYHFLRIKQNPTILFYGQM